MTTYPPDSSSKGVVWLTVAAWCHGFPALRLLTCRNNSDKPVTRRTRPRSRSPVSAGSDRDRTVHPGRTRMFVTAVPGLGQVVRRELSRLPGKVVRDSGFDGRSDVVLFETARESRSAVFDLGLAEDVFVEVGRTLRADGDRSGWIAGRLWRPERVQRALSVWAEEVRPLAGTMTFRVIARGPAGAFLPAHRSAPPADQGGPTRSAPLAGRGPGADRGVGQRVHAGPVRRRASALRRAYAPAQRPCRGARGRAPADGGKGHGAARWRTGWRRARPMLRLGNHPSRSTRGWLGGAGSRHRP